MKYGTIEIVTDTERYTLIHEIVAGEYLAIAIERGPIFLIDLGDAVLLVRVKTFKAGLKEGCPAVIF